MDGRRHASGFVVGRADADFVAHSYCKYYNVKTYALITMLDYSVSLYYLCPVYPFNKMKKKNHNNQTHKQHTD